MILRKRSRKKVKEKIKNDMELVRTGCVDVVKRNTKKEIKDKNIVNTTLEEEKMCQGWHLNVCVIGLKKGASLDKDVETLEELLRYIETLPITKTLKGWAWHHEKESVSPSI